LLSEGQEEHHQFLKIGSVLSNANMKEMVNQVLMKREQKEDHNSMADEATNLEL
jgi:hypothetical protein